MKRSFEMFDSGEMKYFLGVEVSLEADGIHICQKKYVEDILAKFGMTNCN